MSGRMDSERRIATGLGMVCAGLAALAILPWTRDPTAAERPARMADAGAAVTQVPRFEAPPLATLAAMVERPLFAATRRPAPAAASGSAAQSEVVQGAILGRYRFNGVVVTPTVRMVFLTHIKDNKPVAVAQGEKLDEWVVSEVRGDMILLKSGDREERIPVKDPPAAPAGAPLPR